MPFDPNKKNNEPKFMIRFRGSAMIPRLNRMAPCRLELGVTAIKEIMESLHHHPIRIETSYIDVSGKEWPINWTNYRKILPINRTAKTPITPPDDPNKKVPVHDPNKENPATGASEVKDVKEEVTEEKLPEPEVAEVAEVESTLANTAPVAEEKESAPTSYQNNNYQHSSNKKHRR